jgi:hypothetical protein
VIVFKDGKIKKDSIVANARDAAEELRLLPVVNLEEDDEE